MLIENKTLYEALYDSLKTFNDSYEYIFIHAIYEPDNWDDHDGMHSAAVDLNEPGETYHVWFVINDDTSIAIGSVERWFMG